MKKYLVLATAALTLAACSNEETSEQAWNGEIRLSSTTVESRAAGQSLQSTSFDSGEKVDVYINENTSETATTTYTQPLVYTTGTDGALTAPSTQYFPASGNGVNIFAVYPSGAGGADVTATAVEFTINTDQSTDDNYKASDLMTGRPEPDNPIERTATTIPLVFKHCLTKINLNLTAGDGFTADDFENAVINILGTIPVATFNVQTGAVTIDGKAEAEAPAITLGSITASDMPLSASAIIIPQTVAAGAQFIEIDMTQTNNGYLYYSIPATAGVTFAPSTEYTYNITVKKSGLSITGSSITDWTDGGSVNGDAIP